MPPSAISRGTDRPAETCHGLTWIEIYGCKVKDYSAHSN